MLHYRRFAVEVWPTSSKGSFHRIRWEKRQKEERKETVRAPGARAAPSARAAHGQRLGRGNCRRWGGGVTPGFPSFMLLLC